MHTAGIPLHSIPAGDGYTTKEKKLHYKYRGISNLRNLLDIFLNNHLYAATYHQMNDPMEGHYLYGPRNVSPEFRSALKGEKERIGICSLSETSENQLMWAHYAEGHKGIVIGLEVDSTKYDVRLVQYEGLSYLTNRLEDQPIEAAISVLSHKLDIWSYEREIRVFVRNSKFVKVNMKKVIFGSRIDSKDRSFLKKIISKLNTDIQFENAPRNGV